MSTTRTYRLGWPRDIDPQHITTALRALASTASTPVTLDARGIAGHVEHRITVPVGRGNATVTELRSALPGIELEVSQRPKTPRFGLAIDLRLSARRRPLRTDNQTDIARSLVHAVANVGHGEEILLRWLLTDRLYPATVPNKLQLHDESWATALLKAPFAGPANADADTRSALRDKQREPGWRAVGRLAVKAASAPRRQQLASAVLGALRIAEAPGVRIDARRMNPKRLNRTPRHGKVRLNAVELTGVIGWPIGSTANEPVDTLGSRRLPAAKTIPAKGSVVGESTWPASKRQLALAPTDRLRSLHVLGPIGTGKSTLLLNLIEQDMHADRGLVVFDPKGDLIDDILARVPQRRVDDVVVIGPATEDGAVVGVNPLARHHGIDPDVAADHLLEVFRSLYSSAWGPRTADILGAALHSLVRVGGHSLVSVPLLLTDMNFRSRLTAKIDDPVGLGPFWQQFDAWSDAERTTAIAPVLNKLRPYIVRPTLRRIVGQPTPSFSFSDVFTSRRVVLIDLAKGRIGAEASQLLGALALTQLWQAAQARTKVPAERRHPVIAYLDEFQDYMALPLSLEDALVQARGLGVGFVLAHQHLKQLPPTVKAAVLANVRSRICFQLSGDDARELTRDETVVQAEDFRALDAYHFYAQLVARNQVQPWCSGRSLPPSKATADAESIRTASADRYGVPGDEIDAALRSLISGSSGPRPTPGDGLTPRRRGGRS